jgi:N-acetylmuramoyl-L-alanine amidase
MELRSEHITYLIVHHTATARDLTTAEAVRRYHVESRGWGDIGYHYFIEADGRVHKGRPDNVRGAHCRTDDMNGKSLGICLAGHFDLEPPTIEQMITLAALLKALIAKYEVVPEKVLGHCEVAGATTSCPGEVMREWVRIFRAENGG